MNILNTFPMEVSDQQELQSLVPDATWIHEPDLCRAKQHVSHADAIIGNLPPSFFCEEAGERLQWVQLVSSGHMDYSQGEVLSEHTILTTAYGAYGTTVAEHMLGQLLMHLRHLDLYQDAQQHHMRKYFGPVKTICGSTTLVLGLGEIGSSFAKTMNALGSHVLGIRRDLSCKPDYIEAIYPLEQLDELLPQADFVAICLPGDPAFRDLFNSERLALMKTGSVLLNISYGFMVNTDALAQALHQGPLSGACLDMDSIFSLKKDHPLWTAPGLHMTPQIAGSSYASHTYDKILQIIKTNLQTFVNGGEWINRVPITEPRVSFDQLLEWSIT